MLEDISDPVQIGDLFEYDPLLTNKLESFLISLLKDYSSCFSRLTALS